MIFEKNIFKGTLFLLTFIDIDTMEIFNCM